MLSVFLLFFVSEFGFVACFANFERHSFLLSDSFTNNFRE